MEMSFKIHENAMAREYYVSWIRLDSRDYYALWFMNARDGYFVDESGAIPVFAEAKAVRALATSLGLSVVPDEVLFQDLDEVEGWVRAPTAESVNCEALLSGWNLFLDVAHSLPSGEVFLRCDQRSGDVYRKLLRGYNRPALGGGEPRDPVWSQREVETLATVLQAGLELVRSRVLLTKVAAPAA